jgi:hypothetical protein
MKSKKRGLDATINALTIQIKRGEWEIFKSTVPRSMTLNEAVVQLIRKEINKNSRPANDEEIELSLHPKRGRPENRYSAIDIDMKGGKKCLEKNQKKTH